MYKHSLKIHIKKNLKKLILSNFFFVKKNFFLNNYSVKFFFFYNYLNLYLSSFILFNFWCNNLRFTVKKTKFSVISNYLDFFLIFSLFVYPQLNNMKSIFVKNKKIIYFTFFVNQYFFNPLYSLMEKIYKIYYSTTFNLLKFALLLSKEKYFCFNFFLNFLQVPLVLK